MKIYFTFIIVIFILITGCNKVPDTFKTQTMKFLDEGAKLEKAGSQGITFNEFRKQYTNTKASYDLVAPIWPSSLNTDSRGDFEKALQAWAMTLELWTLKIEWKDQPTEPNINGYERYREFIGSQCETKLHDADFSVEAYRNKRYLPFDENIRVLLSIAGDSFKKGRDKILMIIK